MTQDSPTKHFFISYNKADRRWAEWIAWQLEEAGYSTLLQAWDFRPGSNFVLEMDKATRLAARTIAVLSPDYLKALYTQSEWAAAFRLDPTGEDGTLVPVQVRECRYELRGLLRQIISIDLVGQDEPTARKTLLGGIRHERNKPTTAPLFPGDVQHSVSEPLRFPGAFPSTWNIPYPRNSLFTGREDVLKRLYDTLTSSKTAALAQAEQPNQPQAISGIGGIGKTQTAIEYAYRYQSDYQAILWAKADLRETLVSDFVILAGLLNLPEKDAQDQSKAVAALKRWLQTHVDWLLILDNADDLAMVTEFIPSPVIGHILLTTRAQAMGRLAQRIEMEKMEPEEGALFLLRRANILSQDDPIEKASPADQAKAKGISEILDGLPLALDQAGAYIDETGCSLSDYLDLYQKRRTQLLKRRGGLVADHPEPVATTWSLSFEKVEKANPAAADLLRLCAFLHPDAIPEEIITEGADNLGPTLQFVAADPFELNAAIQELRKYSLLHRDSGAKTLTIHRLVQVVLRDTMDKNIFLLWTERAVRAVSEVFPSGEFETWAECERCLPHAQICADYIKQNGMILPEAAQLLNQAGYYLYKRGQYQQAEPLLQLCLQIREQVFGQEHRETARILTNLGRLYFVQGKYDQAELLLQPALAIRERVLGPEHHRTARALNNLAELYRAQGKYEQAEPLYRRAITIYEKVKGSRDSTTALVLNNLAELYRVQGKYEQAEPLYHRALTIREQVLVSQHPDTATSCDGLAERYHAQGKYEQAEQFCQRALTIYEQSPGLLHPGMSRSLNNLANLYRDQGKYALAEPLYQRAIAIGENALGPDHPDVATWLSNLANLYSKQGKYGEAEPLYQQALAIVEKALGVNHPNVATVLENYAALLRKTNREAEAAQLEERAKAIREKHAQENPMN